MYLLTCSSAICEKIGHYFWRRVYIDLLLGSHSASVPYPTVRRFVTEMCTCAHLCCGMVFSGLLLWCTMGFVSWACCRELIALCVSVTAVNSWVCLAHDRLSVFLVLTYLHCTYFAPIVVNKPYWLMFFVCHTTLNKVYLILFYTASTLIPSLISNYIHYKVWDEIIYHSQTSTVAPLKFGNG